MQVTFISAKTSSHSVVNIKAYYTIISKSSQLCFSNPSFFPEALGITHIQHINKDMVINVGEI